jgi:hydrogenase nickel incorporation protein HypA/HybF
MRDIIPHHESIMREIETIRFILAQVLQKADSHPVRDVNLVLGEIADLNDAIIQQHWNDLSKGTLAEQARLHFRFIKAEVQCMACFQKYHPLNKEIHCPYCGSYGAKILSGEEFRLETIELDTQ